MKQKKKFVPPLSYEQFIRALAARGYKIELDKDGNEIVIGLKLKKPKS